MPNGYDEYYDPLTDPTGPGYGDIYGAIQGWGPYTNPTNPITVAPNVTMQDWGSGPLTQPNFGRDPQINLDYSNLDALISQLSGMFGPEGRSEYLTPFRTAGTQQIGRGVSAANRAIASRLAASGIGDSGIATSAIGGTYAAGEQALAQLYSGLAGAGIDYDRLQAGAISSAAGFEAQRQALELQEFATQEEADLARDRLEADIMLQQTQMGIQQQQWEEGQPNILTEILSTLFGGAAIGGLLGWQPFK